MLHRSPSENVRTALLKRDAPELLAAQFQAVSRNLPLMCCLLSADSWNLAFAYAGVAPAWLTVHVPILLNAFCGVGIVAWWQSRDAVRSHEAALRAIWQTTGLAAIFTAGFAVWSWALVTHGAAHVAQERVAFSTASIPVACMFCLIPARQAAIAIAGLASVPSFVVLLTTSGAASIATATSQLLVTASTLVAVLGYCREFACMAETQNALTAANDKNCRPEHLDQLTQLPGRCQFFSRLEDQFLEAVTSSRRLAIVVLDLDGFKPINDLYGHAVGDKVLIAVSDRLREIAADALYVARLGVDEFGFIALDLDDGQLLKLGRSIGDGLNENIVLREATFRLSMSLGIAVFPDLATNATELFERAEYAMSCGKKGDGEKVVLFNLKHEEKLHLTARIEHALKVANLESELSLAFQPIVDLQTHKVVGFEALARWTSPVLGNVSPGLFIPIAERSGTVHLLTPILLNKALAAAAEWPEDIRLAFNLSARDISLPDNVVRIIGMVLDSGLSPHRVEFEITETSVMYDFKQAKAAIDSIRTTGSGVSLDDFGTGFSSLSQLHALPLTKIKIDRSFVTDLHAKPASYKIVKSLLNLSRDMDLECVIEGAETREEIDVLRSMGGKLVQGYYFSKPQPASDLAALFFEGKRQMESA